MKPRKIIIAPDSFKGILSAQQVADVIADEVASAFPECDIVKIPIADGGDGSVDTIITTLGGQIHYANVISPDDRLIASYFGITTDGLAILEMAQSSGIMKQDGLHPMTSSTYGFGQLIIAALDLGARDFILCIGGSATTDGGCGMASALGVRFSDGSGKNFVPCGATLIDISQFDVSGIDKRIRDSKFTVLCDVDNPLFGENGAAYVYGPQKGANPEQVITLDNGLRHLGTKLFDHFGKDYANSPGAGAAGGLGVGCIVFLDAKLKRGSDAILKLCRFEDHLVGADAVITGEGKLDSQSFQGKVLSGTMSYAGDVPIVSICGVCECDDEVLRRHKLTVFETSEGISVEESMNDPKKYLTIAAQKAITALAKE